MKYKSTPPWRDTVKAATYPPLKKDLSVDMLIIGAGIAGVATAYALSKTGKSIALIEKEQIGSGATGHTTAFIAQPIDTDLIALADIFDKNGAKMVWESGGKAIDLIEQHVKKEKIDCEFTRCPYYEFALEEKDNESLQEEAKLAKDLDLPVAYQEDRKLGFNKYGYNEIRNQAKFNPLKYITGLAKAAVKNGVLILENTKALDINENEKKDLVAVSANNSVIIAKQVFVTTYAPFINKWEHFFKAGYYADFMMELEIPKGTIKEALYADSNDPYTYFRIDPQKTFDRMIIGGLTHRVQVPMREEKGYEALEKWIQNVLSDVKYKIVRKWYGRLIEPDDGIPYIGHLTGYDNVYVATAFSGNGMTYSHITAMMFKDIVEGKKNEWADLYNAQRIPNMKSLLQKGKDYSSTLIGGITKIATGDATR